MSAETEQGRSGVESPTAEPMVRLTVPDANESHGDSVEGAEPEDVAVAADKLEQATPTAPPLHHLPPPPTAEEVPDEDEVSARRGSAPQDVETPDIAVSTPAPKSPSPSPSPPPTLPPASAALPSDSPAQVPIAPSPESTAEDVPNIAVPVVAAAPAVTATAEASIDTAIAPAEASPPGPFVRKYDPSKDYQECLEICLKTVGPSLRPLLDTPHKTLISSIYCKPYLLFSTDTCFVLDDGNGTAVGYIIGTPSTTRFISQYKSDYLPLLDFHYPPPPPPKTLEELGERKWLLDVLFDPEKGMNVPEFNGEYDAHFHIDILEGWQGQGWGPKLLESWVEEAKKIGSRLRGQKAVDGVHVGLDPENTRAAKWYEKVGFMKKEVEKGGYYMVKKI